MTGGDVVGSDDRIRRAVLGALATANALFGIDDELNQLLTYAGWTLLVYDVSDVLILEVAESRNNGVGSRLTKAAQRCALDVVAQLFHTVEVF